MRAHRRPVHSSDIAKTVAIVLLFSLVALVLWSAHLLLMVTFLGVLLGLAVSAGVDVLARYRINRGLGAALVVVGTIGIISLLLAWSEPTLVRQSHELRAKFPQALDRVDTWLGAHQRGLIGTVLTMGANTDTVSTGKLSPAEATDSAALARFARGIATAGDSAAVREDSLSLPGTRIRQQMLRRLTNGSGRPIFPFLRSTAEIVGAIIYMLFLAIYVAAEPDVYHSGLLQLIPLARRTRVADVLNAVGMTLRRWLVTQLAVMILVGITTTLLLLIMNIPASVPLGLIAGLMQFIPTIGGVISAVPAVAMGFVESPDKAVIVAVVLFVLHFLTSHLALPLIMKRGVNLPPALTLVVQAFMALLFGFLGLMIAVPALAAAVVVIRMAYVRNDETGALENGKSEITTPVATSGRT